MSAQVCPTSGEAARVGSPLAAIGVGAGVVTGVEPPVSVVGGGLLTKDVGDPPSRLRDLCAVLPVTGRVVARLAVWRVARAAGVRALEGFDA